MMKFDAKQKKRLTMAGSVFAIALGTGFVMQKISPMADRFVGGEGETLVAGSAGSTLDIQPLSTARQERMSEVAEVVAPQAPAAPRATLAQAIAAPAALAAPEPVKVAALSTAPAVSDASPAQSMPAPSAAPMADTAESCAVTLNVEARPAAMARLSFAAPCSPGAPVTLRHGALSFTEVTDADGTLTVDLPALTRKASFEARLDTGERALAMTLIEDAEGYERTVLMWQGRAGVGLHAFENGADYGDAGHISTEAPAGPSRATEGQGGYLTTLGAAEVPGAQMVEVYSYPRAAAGSVAITVEAEVTAANCGREMTAKLLVKTDKSFTPQMLTAAMPDCDAVGEFLVFSGLLPELRFAAAE